MNGGHKRRSVTEIQYGGTTFSCHLGVTVELYVECFVSIEVEVTGSSPPAPLVRGIITHKK